jgi:hypothetical protein
MFLKKVWIMVKNWWKEITDRLGHKEDEMTDVSETSPAEPPLPQPDLKPAEEPMNTDGDQPGTFSRWIQKRQTESNTPEQLSAISKELTALLEKISESSLSQENKLEVIAKNHDQSVNLLDRQGKSLDDLLAEIKRLNAGTDRLILALEALPKSIRQQMEKLTALEDQLQSDGQTDRALLSSMDTLGKNVAVMARFAETEKANREEFAKGLSEQIQPLVDLGKRQQKFNRISLIFTSIIAVVLLTLLVFYVKDILS